jgi:hypothetical protein
VVITVFNYGQYLESCVRSALRQEGVDLNVLVLDDASTDDSLSIARSLAAEDPRVRVIAQPQNVGHIENANIGMTAANSEYVVKLDADDMLTEGSLMRSVALLQAFPSVGFVYGLPQIIGEGPVPAVRGRARSWTIWPGREWLRVRCKRGNNCIRQPEVVIRSSAFREVGPYRKDLSHTHDFELWMRLAARYDVGRVNGVYQGYYREHPASLSRTINGGLLTDLWERARAFDSLFSECSSQFVDTMGMSDIAHRAIAREALGYAVSSYTNGMAQREPADELAALALKICPEADQFREWQIMSRLSEMKEVSRMRYPSLFVREMARNLRFRLLWWQWKLYGV